MLHYQEAGDDALEDVLRFREGATKLLTKDGPVHCTGIGYVDKGYILTYTTNMEGRYIDVEIRGKGEMIGLANLVTDYPYTARPLSDAEIFFWSYADMERQTMGYDCQMVCMKELARQNAQLRRRNNWITNYRQGDQVKALLQDLGRRYCRPKVGENGVTLPFSLTHEMLSGMMGTSRERATLYLNLLQEEQYLDYKARKPLHLNDKLMDEVFA
jgi:CRP-like cAMP-binding protein